MPFDSEVAQKRDGQGPGGGWTDGHFQWESQSAEWKTQLGFPVESRFYTKSKHFFGAGLNGCSKRVFDLVDCVALDTCKRQKTTLKDAPKALEETLLDFSQNHVRRPFSNREGVARTLTTSSQLFSFGLNRVCAPLEHLLLQGYQQDTVIPTSMTPTDVKHMAGEGIALPVLGMVVWSVFLTKGFPLPSSSARSES